MQEETTAIAVRQEHGGALTSDQVCERLAAIKGLMKQAMEPGVDYGVIPGTKNPTLYKSGAEKLGLMFRLDPQFETKKVYHDDGHLTVDSTCIIFHAPSGDRLGGASAICTSKEAKYAFRKAERVCPSCGKPAIIKGKVEYGGGLLCWAKKGGCGAKFDDDEEAITSQFDGDVPNDKIADTWNTVVRMSEKRAYLACMRLVTGCSAIFDEEYGDHEKAMGDQESKPDKPVQKKPAAKPPDKAPDKPPAGPVADAKVLADFDREIVSCPNEETLKAVWKAVIEADHKLTGKKGVGPYQQGLAKIKDDAKKAFAELPPVEDKAPWE